MVVFKNYENKKAALMNKKYYKVKCVLGIIITCILLPLVLLAIVGGIIAIKLEDGGPAFYRADRLGKNGKTFKVWKLRTMVVNAPDIRLDDGSTFNSKDDPRVTKFGKFARKTSMDELPQVFNVLRGEMALIGPRPDLPEDWDNFHELEKRAMVIRPGITGYNQVVNRNNCTAIEKLENDIYYAENMSFKLDLWITGMSVKAVLSSNNVYR